MALPQARTKTVTVKADDDSRTVTARFATFGVVDLDGDIIEPGAIGEQSVFMGAYNHDFAMLPPGMGATYETEDEALFRGEFFETWSGNEHYKTIKAAGGQMDWSFRFFVEEGGFETRAGEDYFVIRKARVAHVAPVETGAGINTGTLEIKSCGPECQANKMAQQGEAREKGSVLIDYSKLAEALAPVVLSAMDSGAGKTTDGCGCGSKSAGDDAARKRGTLLLADGRRFDIDTSTSEGRAALTSRLQGGMGLVEAVIEIAAEGKSAPTEIEKVACLKCGKEYAKDQINDDGQCLAACAAPSTASSGADAGTTPSGSGGSSEKQGGGSVYKGEGLGDLLRQLRDEKELSNDDLATAAGLSVSSIGGILAGTTQCPKIGQLQALARLLKVNLSRLVAAAEADGCDQYEGDLESSANDQGQGKSGDDDPETQEPAAGDPTDPEGTPSDDVLAKQIDDLLSGFPGLPPETDPGLKAWHQYQIEVLEAQET